MLYYLINCYIFFLLFKDTEPYGANRWDTAEFDTEDHKLKF